jgi:probable F420-dependent oxidoreductase
MGNRSPINFSIQLPSAPDLPTWTDTVRRAEDGGFYSVSVPDHLGPSLPQLAPLVALAAAIPVTTTVRLATTVLDNDFRHPVMLAKEIATLDVLSGGRVDLGIGAGWLEEDYTTTGVATWDPPKIRIDRLEESIGVLRALFSGEPVTHEGTHYRIDGFTSFPVPVQSPVPLMMGVRGPRMLRLAARHAQIISVLFSDAPGGKSRAAFEEQLQVVTDAGARERDDVQLGIRIPLGLITGPGESADGAAATLGARVGMSAEEVLDSPYAVVGDPARVRDGLVELAERYGITYVTLSGDLAWQLAPVVDELSR